MNTPIIRDFTSLKHLIDRLGLYLYGGSELNFGIDEFLADDPHTIMLLTWLEMQGDLGIEKTEHLDEKAKV